MNRTPSLKPRQTVVSVPAHADGRTAGSPMRLAFGIALWMIGLVILAALAFFVLDILLIGNSRLLERGILS